MATKLKDLKVTKVDFVDAGANQEANILLFKSKDGTPPADTGKGTALVTPGAKSDNVLKRALTAVAKALGFEDDKAIDSAMENLQKGRDAESFNDKMEEAERRRITSEIWDICYALEESLCSVIQDDEIPWDSKADLMEQSLSQFNTTVGDLIPVWSSGNTAEKIMKLEIPVTPERVANANAAKEALDAIIAKATTEPKQDENSGTVKDGCEAKPKTKKTKGEQKDMKIDKSKLTSEEVAALEAIEKKAGVQEDTTPAPTTDPIAKSAPAAPSANEPEDIYKGLHPAIKAELESLRKTAERLEDRELTEVAKKYEIIGKKAEELVPVFKTLKAAGGDAYNQMITVLDASVEAFDKSGIFKEVGKKGTGTADAWNAIEKHADEIMKSAPTISRTQAIDKACEQHPELVQEYENDR
ncbi:MAG: hypothetical protein RR365_00615 [Bacteroides sp.]